MAANRDERIYNIFPNRPLLDVQYLRRMDKEMKVFDDFMKGCDDLQKYERKAKQFIELCLYDRLELESKVNKSINKKDFAKCLKELERFENITSSCRNFKQYRKTARLFVQFRMDDRLSLESHIEKLLKEKNYADLQEALLKEKNIRLYGAQFIKNFLQSWEDEIDVIFMFPDKAIMVENLNKDGYMFVNSNSDRHCVKWCYFLSYSSMPLATTMNKKLKRKKVTVKTFYHFVEKLHSLKSNRIHELSIFKLMANVSLDELLNGLEDFECYGALVSILFEMEQLDLSRMEK